MKYIALFIACDLIGTPLSFNTNLTVLEGTLAVLAGVTIFYLYIMREIDEQNTR